MNLVTSYMGLTLRNPLIASAAPSNGDLDYIRKLEDSGIGAIVLPSIFEEQIEAEARRYERLTTGMTESFPEALSFFPAASSSHSGPQAYLRLIGRARDAVAVPIIASLNGATSEGWVHYAKEIQQAGAAALELNIYFIPTDLSLDGRAVEQRNLDILRAVRAEVTIPIAVKLNPYFSAMGAFAQELDRTGADALVLFNRLYQPDIDLQTLSFRKDLHLSSDHEIRLPLLWISLLCGRIKASLAASTGVNSAQEILKYLLAGADVVMTTSALLRHGVGHVRHMLDDLGHWLEDREIDSSDAIRGKMSRRISPDADQLARLNYIEILEKHRVH